MESLDNTDLHLDRRMQKITNIEPRLPFAPSFDMADRSMKWVPMTSSETESLWKCSIRNVMQGTPRYLSYTVGHNRLPCSLRFMIRLWLNINVFN